MNKRTILPLLGALLFTLPLRAQFYLEGNAAVVAPGIINQNNYGFSELDYQFKIGSSFGLDLAYAIRSKHHFQLGLNAFQLGQNYGSDLFDIPHEKEVTLNYLFVPLRYKIVLGDTQEQVFGTRAFFSFGVYYAQLRSADVKWFVDDREVDLLTFHQSQDRNDNIETIEALLGAGRNDLSDDADLFEQPDFGVLWTWGVRFFLGSPLAFNMELMGGYGLGEINAEAWRLKNNSGIYEKSNNGFLAFRLSLGYYFGLVGEKK